MKTLFRTPAGQPVQVEMPHIVIGPGAVGSKSRKYIEMLPLIDSIPSSKELSPLATLPLTILTPQLLLDFLKRAGVSHENPGHAEEAMRITHFLPHELDAFKEAMAPFAGLYIAVRSDECTAAGVGLWHTDFMIAGTSEDAVKRFAEIAKEILISDFSLSAIAFKKRIGVPLEQTPGVFVMPAVGSRFGDFFLPFYSANAITRFIEPNQALVMVGTGIGGANSNYDARTMILTEQNHANPDPSFWLTCTSHTKALIDGTLKVISEVCGQGPSSSGFKPKPNETYFFSGLRSRYPGLVWPGSEAELGQIASSLSSALNGFTELAPGARYLELVLDYAGGQKALPNWVVVQCADHKIREVETPPSTGRKLLQIVSTENPSHKNLDFGLHVLGRGIIETDHILYMSLDDSTSSRLMEFNEKLSNYVLVLNSRVSMFVRARIPFHAYSNASAIVLSGAGIRSIYTHLGGALCETGILVLAYPFIGPSQEFLPFLHGLKYGINKKKLQIYANDGVQEGFVASLD
ncbi:MAG: hypothetical protein WC488_01030 [Candidatus Micrarchaeia archaeon]